MERGRILILGQTKDSTYEIRNLLDNRRYELEIALSREVAKQILAQRRMDLLIIHTEMLDPEMAEFFEFLEERGIELPVFVLGEEADKFRDTVPVRSEVSCFDKPYPIDQMVASIQAL
jgi:response regulator RpfG family c-di-GMP phosphodiesterase